MDGVSSLERLQVAFDRYRREMAVRRPSDPAVPLRAATARLDLALSLVEAGEPLPDVVADQVQADALQLVAETDPLPV
jgi:hypothetical protein